MNICDIEFERPRHPMVTFLRMFAICQHKLVGRMTEESCREGVKITVLFPVLCCVRASAPDAELSSILGTTLNLMHTATAPAIAVAYNRTPHIPLHSHPRATQLTMSLLRTSRVLSSARGQLQIVPRLTAPSIQQRQISSTPARRGGDAHGDHYDPPTGWLFGVKPGEKPEKEGWENVFFYGFFGSVAFGVVGYWFKPDTR